MDVSLLSPPVSSAPCACADNQPTELTTYSVILAPLPCEHHWKPKSCRTPIPSQAGNLPQSMAIEAANSLNEIYKRAGKYRIAVAFRIQNGTSNCGVVTVEATPNIFAGKKLRLPNVEATGLLGPAAQAEVERLNSLILQYAQVPKVWAIAVVEKQAAIKGEGVSA